MQTTPSRIFLALVFSLCCGLVQADEVTWISDSSGCSVANIFPQEGESINWYGTCKKGRADGRGKLIWFLNGQTIGVYEGQMVDGWAEGQGKFTRKDGVYTGEWKNSLQNGKGHYQHEDGSWYEGSWKDGHPHGHGQMRTPEGKLFSGTWYNGQYEDERVPANRT